jgi:hypothetical protein
MNWMGRTSPDDVTVDLSSGRFSVLTTVTSGVSDRDAKMLTAMIATRSTPATAPMMIFDFRLNAILFNPLVSGIVVY